MSTDPDLVEKVGDLVALDMNAPVAAAVFAVDEKPQFQALNRTAPTLAMLPTTRRRPRAFATNSEPARTTHDYEHNGTCDLFAALNIATGPRSTTSVLPTHERRLRRVLKHDQSQRSRPPRRARRARQPRTHETPNVQRWPLCHRRFHFISPRPSGSWMNVVERWFSAFTTKQLQPSAHRNVKALDADIEAWAAHWREPPARSYGTRPPRKPRTRGRLLRRDQRNDNPMTQHFSQRFTLPGQ